MNELVNLFTAAKLMEATATRDRNWLAADLAILISRDRYVLSIQAI